MSAFRFRHLCCSLALALGCAAAHAGDISVGDPYVRLVPPGMTSTAAFMTVHNGGSGERKLLRVESAVAASVELHRHVNDNGVMRMRPVEAIAIAAGGDAELRPGGYHVMLIGLKQALREGEKVPLTLVFDDGSRESVGAVVRSPLPPAATHDHEHMGH